MVTKIYLVHLCLIVMFLSYFLPTFASNKHFLCNTLISEGKYIKQDMFMYMGVIHIKGNEQPIMQQPFCMHITADFSIPTIFTKLGFSRKETINLFAFKQFDKIKDFDFKLEILN